MFPLEFRSEVNRNETRVMVLLCGESCMILTATVFDWSTRVTDGQTDGRTIAYSAIALCCRTLTKPYKFKWWDWISNQWVFHAIHSKPGRGVIGTYNFGHWGGGTSNLYPHLKSSHVCRIWKSRFRRFRVQLFHTCILVRPVLAPVLHWSWNCRIDRFVQ